MLLMEENGPVEVSEQSVHLIEKQESGFADLQIELQSPCILFRDLEKKKLQYFKNQKCADYILYEKSGEDWNLHIFELKRTVKSKEWEVIKEQFAGALQNAFAIAGFLDISICMERVYMHTVYRNDKINDKTNPALLRYEMHQREKGAEESFMEWKAPHVMINFEDGRCFSHDKIPLDIEKGTGIYSLKENRFCSGKHCLD